MVRCFHGAQLRVNLFRARGQVHLGRALLDDLVVDQGAQQAEPEGIGLLLRGLLLRLLVASLVLVRLLDIAAQDGMAVDHRDDIRRWRFMAAGKPCGEQRGRGQKGVGAMHPGRAMKPGKAGVLQCQKASERSNAVPMLISLLSLFIVRYFTGLWGRGLAEASQARLERRDRKMFAQ